MDDRPTNKEIADAVGITENQAGTYVVQCTPLSSPNGWMFTFAAEMPADLRKKIKGLNKALVCTRVIPPRR